MQWLWLGSPISGLGAFNPDIGKATVEPLEFDLSPTSYPEAITVFGVDDSDATDEITDIDPQIYGDLGRPFPVRIIDNDALNLDCSPWNITLHPLEAATVGVRLTQPPSETVMVTLESSDPTVADVMPRALVLGPRITVCISRSP